MTYTAGADVVWDTAGTIAMHMTTGAGSTCRSGAGAAHQTAGAGAMYTRIRQLALVWPTQLETDTVGAGKLQSTVGTTYTAGAGATCDAAGAGAMYMTTDAGNTHGSKTG